MRTRPTPRFSSRPKKSACAIRAANRNVACVLDLLRDAGLVNDATPVFTAGAPPRERGREPTSQQVTEYTR